MQDRTILFAANKLNRIDKWGWTIISESVKKIRTWDFMCADFIKLKAYINQQTTYQF